MKWLVFTAAVAGMGLLAGDLSGKEPDVKTLAGQKVAMIVAFRDFRDEEFYMPYNSLKSAGASVVVVCSKMGRAAGMLGKTIEVNARLDAVAATDFNGIIFVGGGGARDYFHDPVAHRLVQDAFARNKVVGAICIAPAILAHAGVLKGRKATGFQSILPVLTKAGALVQDQPVVRDGKLVTADGPQSASGFASAVVEALSVTP